MTQLPNWFNEMQKTVLDKMKTLALPKADGTVIKKWAFDQPEMRQEMKVNQEDVLSALTFLNDEAEKNMMIVCDGEIIYKKLTEAFDGVTIATLEEALTTYEELFKSHLMSVVPMEENQLVATNVAHLNLSLIHI